VLCGFCAVFLLLQGLSDLWQVQAACRWWQQRCRHCVVILLFLLYCTGCCWSRGLCRVVFRDLVFDGLLGFRDWEGFQVLMSG
jgi:hypothetical protein